jgi:Flp pilus assembly protein TadG
MLKRMAILKDRSGLAAVEFALIAPVMIVMFYGAVELSSAVDCKARVTRAVSTVADLVSQETTISTADAANVFSAAGAILLPYASSNAKIVVSSLVTDDKGVVTVPWSEALNTTKRTTAPANIPTGVLPASSSVIYAEITYNFTPAVTEFIGNFTLTNSFYAKPRRSSKVTHT